MRPVTFELRPQLGIAEYFAIETSFCYLILDTTTEIKRTFTTFSIATGCSIL